MQYLNANNQFINEVREKFANKGFTVKTSWYSDKYKIFVFEVYKKNSDLYDVPNFYFEIDTYGSLLENSILLNL